MREIQRRKKSIERERELEMDDNEVISFFWFPHIFSNGDNTHCYTKYEYLSE